MLELVAIVTAPDDMNLVSLWPPIVVLELVAIATSPDDMNLVSSWPRIGVLELVAKSPKSSTLLYSPFLE